MGGEEVRMIGNLISIDPAWIGVWCFALMVASAVLPWVNAELIVLSLPAFAKSPAGLFGLVVLATAGHMLGKCAVYWTGRGGGRVGGRVLSPRVESAVAKWRDRLTRPRRAVSLVAFSSLSGLPPFYFVSLAAGALRMNFALYLAAGSAGRLLRFGVLVMIPLDHLWRLL
jgi:membrane protein YqaA with SNARE-associated domain